MGDFFSAGVIGVGNMGGMVASRLLACGVPTRVYDVRREEVDRFVKAGAEAARSPKEIAERSDVVVVVVPNAEAVRAVYTGDDGIVAGAPDGLVCVEMGTTHPSVAREMEEALSCRGARLIAAAIGGSNTLSPAEQAARGEFVLMVGGADDAIERARPVFDALSQRLVRCDSPEAAVTLKILNNLLAGLNLACSLEVLTLGRKCGLTTDTMMEAFTRTAADNARLHVMIPDQVLPRDFTPGLSMRLSRKDSDLALDLARRAGVPLFFGTRLHELRTAAVNRGLGELDQSALVRVFEELAGVRIS